jgi:hypothetical protein
MADRQGFQNLIVARRLRAACLAEVEERATEGRGKCYNGFRQIPRV